MCFDRDEEGRELLGEAANAAFLAAGDQESVGVTAALAGSPYA